MELGTALIRLNYYWRLFATASSFFVFGLGGILIGLLAYPLLLLVKENKRSQYGQTVIHWSFGFFVWFMKLLGVFTIETKHTEKLKNSGLYLVANHPTLIDVAILLSMVKQSDCVVKSKLAQNFFTKGPLLTAGYIENNTAEQLLDSCVEALNAGRNLLIFPEGTRTKNLDKLNFKRGAALIGIKAAHNIVPITIKCTPRMLAKGQKWYKIPLRKPHFTIKVGDELSVNEFVDSKEALSIRSRKLNRKLLNYYNEELKIGKTYH